jgi:hypothetical protein
MTKEIAENILENDKGNSKISLEMTKEIAGIN